MKTISRIALFAFTTSDRASLSIGPILAGEMGISRRLEFLESYLDVNVHYVCPVVVTAHCGQVESI